MKKILYVLILMAFSIELLSQINVFSDFENGNVEILEINDSINSIFIKPALENENNTTRCWFYFGVTGIDTSREFRIVIFNSNSIASPNYPVYSFDDTNWFRFKSKSTENDSKTIIGKFNSDTVYFATGYPYTYSKLIKYVDSISQNRYIDTFLLCKSEGGLNIPMFKLYDKNHKQNQSVWIIGRQHAFEVTMNYVLEGFLDFLMSENSKAQQLRTNTMIFVVPMVDVDNVLLGGSGRMQKPVDFNRDWSNDPYWIAVEEIQKMIISSSKIYKYRVFMDFHSTYPGTLRPTFGLFNEYSSKDRGFKKLRNYFQIFKKNSGYDLIELSGDMKNYYADAYNSGNLYPFIKTRDFATTVECDWNINNNYKELTIDELRNVGKLMAESLCDYLNK